MVHPYLVQKTPRFTVALFCFSVLISISLREVYISKKLNIVVIQAQISELNISKTNRANLDFLEPLDKELI